MEKNGMDRNLVCVLFPGIVKNDDKAIQCLGGIKNISQIYSQPAKKRLGLCYNPDNPYVKRIYADNRKTAGVVLKIKVKKVKTGNEIKREVISTSVVGRVRMMYKFEAMCDFQYLPVDSTVTGPPQCILDQIIPKGMDKISFMQEPAPLFITPDSFTRSDKPTNYAYTEKRYPTLPNKRVTPERDDSSQVVHSRIRSARALPPVRYKFNLIDDLPTKPPEFYITQKNSKVTIMAQLEQDFEIVKKLFEERPVWSLNLIRYETKIRYNYLKIILPCLSFYMTNGPWRMLWIRYGYDPRKEPGARIYQTLDFRLRHQAGVKSMVMTREQVGYHKRADRAQYLRKKAHDEQKNAAEIYEGAVRFRPGMAPSQRQIFYQYCDVKLPEVEAILSAEPAPGYLCHQKRGWLPANTDHECRDHIFRYVKQTLLSSHSADLKFEQGSSDDESSSDDADTSNAATEIDEATSTKF